MLGLDDTDVDRFTEIRMSRIFTNCLFLRSSHFANDENRNNGTLFGLAGGGNEDIGTASAKTFVRLMLQVRT